MKGCWDNLLAQQTKNYVPRKGGGDPCLAVHIKTLTTRIILWPRSRNEKKTYGTTAEVKD
jgi:hypothetical protein